MMKLLTMLLAFSSCSAAVDICKFFPFLAYLVSLSRLGIGLAGLALQAAGCDSHMHVALGAAAMLCMEKIGVL